MIRLGGRNGRFGPELDDRGGTTRSDGDARTGSGLGSGVGGGAAYQIVRRAVEGAFPS
jgi:hypothetical protein